MCSAFRTFDHQMQFNLERIKNAIHSALRTFISTLWNISRFLRIFISDIGFKYKYCAPSCTRLASGNSSLVELKIVSFLLFFAFFWKVVKILKHLLKALLSSTRCSMSQEKISLETRGDLEGKSENPLEKENNFKENEKSLTLNVCQIHDTHVSSDLKKLSTWSFVWCFEPFYFHFNTKEFLVGKTMKKNEISEKWKTYENEVWKRFEKNFQEI